MVAYKVVRVQGDVTEFCKDVNVCSFGEEGISKLVLRVLP